MGGSLSRIRIWQQRVLCVEVMVHRFT